MLDVERKIKFIRSQEYVRDKRKFAYLLSPNEKHIFSDMIRDREIKTYFGIIDVVRSKRTYCSNVPSNMMRYVQDYSNCCSAPDMM